MSAATLPVAHTILDQLGGSRFVAMTGAKHFVGRVDGLAFRIPRTNGVSQVSITLAGDDTYTVEFIAMRGAQLRVVAKYEGVYCDQLQGVMTDATVLRTQL